MNNPIRDNLQIRMAIQAHQQVRKSIRVTGQIWYRTYVLGNDHVGSQMYDNVYAKIHNE